ncbi:MAG: NYN domain-containing protein [Lachnospiraceae bacterium]|nr:NYN domain-containing protein [Lachnospiraceae bacterium]
MNKVVGIIAHVDAGKTTLSEALLYSAGSIRKLGRVDRQDAFLDNFELERKRGITIFSKQAIINVPDKITLLDTPGHTDFQAETFRTLSVLDYAILVISASEKINSHTISLYKMLLERNIPTLIFLNKMDMPTADSSSIIQKLNELFDVDFVKFVELSKDKNSSEDSIRTISLFSKKDNESIDTFYENIATCDEEVLNSYMEDGAIEDSVIADLIADCKLVPVIEGSALKLKGIEELINIIKNYSLEREYPDEPEFITYKISRDDKGNKLTHVKITGGRFNTRDIVDDEKITEIRFYSGEKYETRASAEAGDLVVFMGLENSKFTGEDQVMPVMTYTIRLPEGVSIHEFLPKMKILQEEEPSLNLEYNEELKEIQVRIFGKVQMEVLKTIIKSRFGVDIDYTNGKIVYKETVASVTYGAGHFEPLRHYAEAHVRIEPAERGSGITIKSECSTDDLALNWQRLIATHLSEREFRGVLTGSPLTDVCFTIVAGRAHNKHTEGGDFRQATYRAVRQGLMKAENVLLEPYYVFTLTIPMEYVGRAMTDLEKMGADINAPESNGEISILKGKVSVSAITDYNMEVTSYTKGAGILELEPCGYDICKNAEEVIAARNYNPDEDIMNPSGSVFCHHGSGEYVPWDEADSQMHVQIGAAKEAIPEEIRLKQIGREIEKKKITEDELNEIFNRTFGSKKDDRSSRFKYKKRRSYGPDSIKSTGSHTYNSKEDYEKINKKKGNSGKNILLVDGYNVIHAWKDLSDLANENLDAARGKLMDTLCEFAAYRDYELILVFDAYRVKGNLGEMSMYNNIHLVYTKEAQTADEYIAKAAIELGDKNRVTVATSDALIQLIIRGNNCLLMSSNDLLENVNKAKEQIREQL